VATAVAEFFRDRGANVLLLMDSLTRLATAQRQIGLAAGEPPASKGYTPSVFSLLPELLERSGRTESGSITGFYSVLVEGDDMNEPVSDTVRSVTDGHIRLSRTLAQRGQYPAIDVLASVSRVMKDVTEPDQRELARRVGRWMSLYAEIEDLVTVGAYQGGDADCDTAVAAMPLIREFLSQRIEQRTDFDDARQRLVELVERIEAAGAKGRMP
jgi:flagellum-specific ATP synthase